MQRFKKYVGKDFILESVRDQKKLDECGLICNDLPESIGDFDEIEMNIDFEGKTILMAVAILEGKIKRIMLIQFDRENPEIPKPLTESELKSFLDARGEKLVSFFEYITR